VLDDIERFLRQGKTTGESDPFYQGAVLIAQKLEKILLSEGLEPFDASGKPFDVEFHDALQQVPRTDVPPQTVLEVVERGYTLHGRVIRHAKVLVSSAPPPDRPEESAPNADTAPRTDVH
jgi:molecular chaperone GrpE